MTFWIIEPRDPLIVRDGRPFGPNPGARATTLPFPFPSTLVGALRHKAGLDSKGQFDTNAISDIMKHQIHGPILVELCDYGKINDWLLPVPADALVLEPKKASGATITDDKRLMVQRFWMRPDEMPKAITNMPDGLFPVGPAAPHPEKVSADAPHFWNRNELYQWLLSPTDDKLPVLAKSIGIRGLEINTRMHVSIQPEQQTAIEGALFQTSGLEFTWRDWEAAKQHAFTTKRFALTAWYNGDTPNFNDTFAPLGGERRLMRWDRTQPDTPIFTDMQRKDIFKQIKQDRRCRVVLLTPAYFTNGYRPTLVWESDKSKVKVTLKAVAVPRSQTISGWDLAANNGRGLPKPTRRLAPAGSVYFVEFNGLTDTQIEQWLKDTWMCNVSDNAPDDGGKTHPCQYRRDGFGLAVIGTWNKN